jgi:F1F0 ATPase subunit 2
MSDFLNLAPALIAGIALGAFFFGGLWWTVRQAASSRWAALWFFASLLLRTGTVLVGFYFACGSDWQRWLGALLGFTVARFFVTRLTRPALPFTEDSHAP